MEILGRFCRNPQRGVAADLCRMADLHSARSQLLSSSLPGREEAMLRQVSLKVSRRDGMYEPNRAADYLSVGLSAIRCIQRALEEPGRTKDVQPILDFLSGYGRVLRFLRVRFPNADITAGEIDPAVLRFCEPPSRSRPRCLTMTFVRCRWPADST
jgi:hypothetical protein